MPLAWSTPPEWAELQGLSTYIEGQFSSWQITDDKLNIEDSAAILSSRLCTAIPKCANIMKEIVYVVEHDGNEVNFNKTRDFVTDLVAAMSVGPGRTTASMIVASDSDASNSTIFNHLSQFISAADNRTSDYFEAGFTLDEAVSQAVFMEGRATGRIPMDRDIVIISRNAATVPAEFNGTVFQVSLDGGASAASSDNTFSSSLDDLSSLTQNLGEAMCTNVVSSCTGNQVDVTVLMDSSGSLGRANFVRNIEYLKDLAASLELSENGIHMSVVQYSSNGMESLDVPFTYNLDEVVSDLNAAVYQDGFTHTGAAMVWTWNNVMNTYQRSGNHVLIVMTDGKAMDPEVVDVAASTIKGYARVYAIGIGRDVRRRDLYNIATDPEDLELQSNGNLKKTVWRMDYDNLAVATHILGDEICTGSLARR